MSDTVKKTSKAKILSFQKKLPLKKQYAEKLRLRIVAGDRNVGKSYILLGENIIIGRDDSCDIFVEDINVSRKHAKLTWNKDSYFINDLESANGIIVNSKKVTQARIEPKDTFKVGGSIFEVISTGKQSQVSFPSKASSNSKKKNINVNDDLKKNKIIITVVLLLLLFLTFSSSQQVLTFREKAFISFTKEEKPLKKISKKEGKALLKEKHLIDADDSDSYKKANFFYKEGVRELYNENFRRAIDKFEVAITLYPRHALANINLEIAKTRLKQKAKKIYSDAIYARKSLRYRDAKMYYSNVIRLLQSDPKDQLYIDSKEAMEAIRKKEKKKIL